MYKIPLKEERTQDHLAYIWVTNRNLSKKLAEHKRDIKHANLTTSLALEAYDKDLSIYWDDAKIIKKVNPGTKPIITESLEILKRIGTENLVNERTAWDPPDPWKYVFNKGSH